VAEPLLDISGLDVRFATPDGEVRAVSQISLDVAAGECLGIVGESGSGKSQLFLAVMGLLASNGRAEGSVRLRGRDLIGLPAAELNKLRGRRMAMVFQDPMTSLNPYLRVGRQLTEVLTTHKGLDEGAARKAAIAMLERVRIPDAAKRIDHYPHEFSGGMRQRVMLAMALLCDPDLLIADEPTTALDVTIQAHILDLFAELRREINTAIVLITHDLGVVAGLADRVAVMYAGRVVEVGAVDAMFGTPRHPYTQALLRSMPRLDRPAAGDMPTIGGQPPNLQRLPPGCAFHDRCERAIAICRSEVPASRVFAPGRAAACHLVAS
jgi:oligopeptide transport system ATP-binding protein